MNYELVKQLKDAGFPQKGKGTYVEIPYHPESLKNKKYNQDQFKEAIYVPTLSELIEACGDGFLNMYKTKDGIFHCVNPFEDKDDEVGSTPEEAVARLWLAINKK